MKLAVITPAYYPNDEPWWRLRESCRVHGLPLFPFGCGDPWHGDLKAHFEGSIKAIAALPEQYDMVMFTDSGDTFVQYGEDAILGDWAWYQHEKADHAHPVVMAAEQSLYPWGLEQMWAESTCFKSDSLWKHPNGGGWIGPRNEVVKLVEWTRDNCEGNEAQRKWVEAYCKNKFMLDCGCTTFQPMSGATSDWEWKDRRLFNKITKTFPCVIHFNGRIGGIEEFYAKAYGG